MQGRGGSTGYDNAVALPAASDADEYLKENVKSTKALKGSAVFAVAKVDPVTGEIAGVFESIQPSDTDLGAKPPKDVKITGESLLKHTHARARARAHMAVRPCTQPALMLQLTQTDATARGVQCYKSKAGARVGV